METSFANGGQISTSHVEPWANPATPKQVLKWLGREDSPMLFRLRADPYQWAWGLSFLRECLPARTRANAAQIAAINRYSRAQLLALRAETGIEYEQQTRGILHFFQDRRALDEARRGRRRGAAAGHRSACAERGRVHGARARAVVLRHARRRGRMGNGGRVRRCAQVHPGAGAALRRPRRAIPLRQPHRAHRHRGRARAAGAPGQRRGARRPMPMSSRWAATAPCCCGLWAYRFRSIR